MKVQEAVFSIFPFKFHLVWNNSGELIKLNFKFGFDMAPKVYSMTSSKVLEWIEIFYRALLDYWNFKKHFLDISHKILLTDFEIAVLKELRKLKIGEVSTYKELAEKSGYKGAYRAVGRVLAKNPLPLVYPCHRIIGKKGLTGYSQGVLIKQFLLYREMNYRFLTNSVKNMTYSYLKGLEI